MDDPSRLMNGDGGIEREILGAWRTRQPSEAARARTLAVVGVGAALGGVAAKAGASVAPKAALATASLLKWLAIGVGLVAIAGVVVYFAGGWSVPSATPPVPAAPVTAAPPIASPIAPSADLPTNHATSAEWLAPPASVAPTPDPPPVAAPTLPLSPVAPPHASTPAAAGAAGGTTAAAPSVVAPKSSAPAVAPASSLDDEVVAIDGARRAVTSGDAATALPMVDAYDARYPNGALAQESAEIRIEALFRLGKRAPAERLAERFLAAHPTSPYARVVRALLAGTPTPAR